MYASRVPQSTEATGGSAQGRSPTKRGTDGSPRGTPTSRDAGAREIAVTSPRAPPENGYARAGPDQDSNRAEQQDASSCRGPLPDLLPQNEHPPWALPPRQRGLGGEATQQPEERRVANQLRIIGDEFNSTILRRAHVAPQWQDWRDVCRGFLNFIAQTLSTLYRLT